MLKYRQDEYFDSKVQDESPNATRARLAKLAGSVNIDQQKILDLISLTGTSANSGTKVTDDLKLQVKLGRSVCPSQCHPDDRS